ncbi:hypothetical protein LNAOJCKE_4082 [Methylorubrum aminovorans]|uniref:DUF222 domain-containing protein n=1 Tax=Methylorubrum aminovorans TaxID=269069 RepID=A0ABQ4UIM7_9HYPH|nr:hypothetical protein [Methylorubrum aminovorans]GJE66858.1 hypothetical protein LNAOJCKE_4082 [Methylorubrum aminovorans]GMA74934.1 hypothetical protein GCM10025880_13510 [Methylorubrum aminovorans]
MNFFARLFASIARAMSGAWHFMSDAFEEAVSPATRRLPWLRDRARAAGRLAGQGASVAADAAAVTAEVALKAPGAVARELGSVVGSMLPSPQISGRALAEGAAVTDDELKRIAEAAGNDDGFFERQRPRVGHGHFLQHAVEAYRDGGVKALAPHIQWISEPAAEWICELSHLQIETALAMAPDALKRHVMPEKASDVSPLLPTLLPVGPAPKVDPTLVTEEMKADILARAKRSMASDRAGVAEMMKRGPSATPARPEPRFDGTADEMPRYARGYRPRGTY